LRHFVTVGREIPSCPAISEFDRPAAAANTLLDRDPKACAVVRRRDQLSEGALILRQLDCNRGRGSHPPLLYSSCKAINSNKPLT
jgi:hypothetical protein